MAKKVRTQAQMLDDYVEIEMLSHRGFSHGEIAKKLSAIRPYKLSRSQIQYDSEHIKQMWRENATKEIGVEKERILSEIRMMKKTLYALLEKSVRTNIIKTKEAQMVGGQLVGQKMIEKSEEELGDMRIAAEIRAYTVQEMVLLGIADKRIDVTSKDEALPPSLIRVGIDPDEL
jgi:hypothetical protein